MNVCYIRSSKRACARVSDALKEAQVEAFGAGGKCNDAPFLLPVPYFSLYCSAEVRSV